MRVWEQNGVRGTGDRPAIAGDGPLLVCGSGRSLWADLACFGAPGPHHVMAVNQAGLHLLRPFDHWASLHGDQLVHWYEARRIQYPQDRPLALHSDKPRQGVTHAWDLEHSGGCSGLFAALVGLAMGYAPVVLAGVPEDAGGHYYDPPGEPGSYSNSSAQAVWTWAREHVFRGRVRSLSGRTRDWLGAP